MADWAPVITRNPQESLPALGPGATLTGPAGAWGALGATAQIAAAGTVPAGDFTIDSVSLDTPSGAMIGELYLYYGALDVLCGSCKFEVATDAAGYMPFPVLTGVIPGGSRIHGAISTAAGGAQTVGVTVNVRPL